MFYSVFFSAVFHAKSGAPNNRQKGSSDVSFQCVCTCESNRRSSFECIKRPIRRILRKKDVKIYF